MFDYLTNDTHNTPCLSERSYDYHCFSSSVSLQPVSRCLLWADLCFTGMEMKAQNKHPGSVEDLHWCSREAGLTRIVLETYNAQKYISVVWLVIDPDAKLDVLGITCSHWWKSDVEWSSEWGQHKIKDKSHPDAVVLGLVSWPLMILSCFCDGNALWQAE